MSYGTRFTIRKIRGKQVELYVSPDGAFNADIESGNLEAKSVEDLVFQIDKALKVKVSIPFHRWEDGKLVEGVVTGRHWRTNNFLVRIGGKSEQEYPPYNNSNGKYLRLNAEEEAQYTALKQAEEAAEKASQKFESEHGINMREEVEEKMDK